jgi:arylsulfatase
MHPHQTGVGLLTGDDGPGGYPGSLSGSYPTIAERLQAAGYATAMFGKWHLSHEKNRPDPSWPTRRGFQHFFGTLDGCGSYFAPRRLTRGESDASSETLDPDFYYTTAISKEAASFLSAHHANPAAGPSFTYVAYTAPHYPLQAPAQDIAAVAGRYDAGWDDVRSARVARQRELGILPDGVEASPRDAGVPAWDDVEHPAWERRLMEVYAAQVEVMDRGIGLILQALRASGQLDNTLIIFLSDNGACAEEMPPGTGSEYHARGRVVVPSSTRSGAPIHVGRQPQFPAGGEDTYMMYGRGWANVSNTPFRLFKRWVHEGGIASPFIAHWPDGIRRRNGALCGEPHYLPDVVPTLLQVAGADPSGSDESGAPPLVGLSMLGVWRGGGTNRACRDQCVEHMGNAAVRRGPWKLVRAYPEDWELYDIERDPTELVNIARCHPDVVLDLARVWVTWAAGNGVVPYERIAELERWGIASPD